MICCLIPRCPGSSCLSLGILVEVGICQCWDTAGKKGGKTSARAGWRSPLNTSKYPLAYLHFILMQKHPLEGILRPSRKEAVVKQLVLPCAPPGTGRNPRAGFLSLHHYRGLRAGRAGMSLSAPRCRGYAADSRQERGIQHAASDSVLIDLHLLFGKERIRITSLGGISKHECVFLPMLLLL